MTTEEKEFSEIAHAGGRLDFVHRPGGVALRYTFSGGGGAVLTQVAISSAGEIIGLVPPAGMGGASLPPVPVLIAFLISDGHGLFGRVCPRCHAYFRTDSCRDVTACPYCTDKSETIAFLTVNQREFIAKFVEAFQTAWETNVDVAVDLTTLIRSLPANTSGWVYAEERQQTAHTCKHCATRFDILGEYAACPGCSRHNWREIFVEKMEKTRQEFDSVEATLTDRAEREEKWRDLLVRGVSDFESLGNEVKRALARLKMAPKRRNSLSNLSLQNPAAAAAALETWFDIRLLSDMAGDDKEFLVREFNRRHLFAHHAGRVDEEYLTNTGDTSVRVNEKVRLRSREIQRLLPLLGRLAHNLISGFEAIT